jgi:hypothetical protein
LLVTASVTSFCGGTSFDLRERRVDALGDPGAGDVDSGVDEGVEDGSEDDGLLSIMVSRGDEDGRRRRDIWRFSFLQRRRPGAVVNPLLQVDDQHTERHPKDPRESFVVVERSSPPLLREHVAHGSLRDAETLGKLTLRPALAF